MLFPANTKCKNWRTKLNSKGLKKDWKLLSECLMEKTSVTRSFGYLNTCKANIVYLENVNFIFISRKR